MQVNEKTVSPSTSTPASLVYSTQEGLVQDFASRGLVVLAAEDLGIPLATHERIYQREKQRWEARKAVTPACVPEVLEVINSPGVIAACNQLVGENLAIVPFTHNATFTSGTNDQHWHKDDNAPYNSRKQRHHQAVQIEMLYYPQAVREDMGPTATVPIRTTGLLITRKITTISPVRTTSILTTISAAWNASPSAGRTPNTTKPISSIDAPPTTCA